MGKRRRRGSVRRRTSTALLVDRPCRSSLHEPLGRGEGRPRACAHAPRAGRARRRHRLRQWRDADSTRRGVSAVCVVRGWRRLGVGIDRSAPAIEMARRRAAERRSPIARTHIEWRVGDASGLVSEDSAVDRAFDAALCVGATGAFGGFQPALGVLRRIARPGGRVVVGEGFWRTPPHADYLAALGATADEMTSHAGNVEAAIASGFTPLYSVTSSDDEWDHYEGLYLHAMERWLAEHPGDPDHAAFTARIHAWRDAYLRWGRSTLGFGVYVLRCPDQG
ncbi:MAG: class I SAM-dependent methyltransferase [Phycisphaerales bacterium]